MCFSCNSLYSQDRNKVQITDRNYTFSEWQIYFLDSIPLDVIDLSLFDNNIEVLGIELNKLNELNKLYIHEDGLHRIEFDIFNLPALDSITINGTRLLDIKNPERESNISYLNLGYNDLLELRIDFSLFPKLKTLVLDGVDLSTFDLKRLCQLESVEVLYLNSCKLSQMPYELQCMRRLSTLWVGLNSFTEIDVENELFSKLSDLYFIDFKGDYELIKRLNELHPQLKVYLWKDPKVPSILDNFND